MPIYEYRCVRCGATSEFLFVGTGNQTPICRECGGDELEKVFSVSHSITGGKRSPGHTCCGREERCSAPPCSTGGSCRRD